MDALLSEPKLIHAKFGDEYELKVTGSSSKLFQTWVQEASDADLCSYLRAVSDGIAQRNLEHYHFKICNGKYNSRTRSQELKWSIAILYGGTAAEGPLTVSRCMSCDMQCPLVLGVLGEQQTAAAGAADTTAAAGPDLASVAAATTHTATEPAAADVTPATTASSQQQQQQQSPVSADSLLLETDHSRVWLDAKARPMFVITPRKHLEKLSDLSDAEVVDLFRTAVAVVQDMGCSRLNTMVLNHGDNRNHAHLHLKVRVHEPDFNKAAEGWSAKHKAQLQLLREFRDSLPPENRGTREAFLLRVRGRQQQQQQQKHQGQYQQQQQPWKQQRPYRQHQSEQGGRGREYSEQQHGGRASGQQQWRQQHQQQHPGRQQG